MDRVNGVNRMDLLSAITFDVWETLIHDPDGAEQVRIRYRNREMARILDYRGWPTKPEALAEAYRAALPEMESVWQGLRDFDTPEQVACILRHLRPSPADEMDPATLAELTQVYAQAVLEIPPDLVTDVPAVLDDVAARRLRIGLICNTGRTPGWALRELFRRFGILRHFEALAFSNEERIRKPDPEIFRRTLGRMGLKAVGAAHVGDDVTSDVFGAKRVGMRAILVQTSAGQEPQVRPDACLSRLGELPALLDAWA